MKRANLTSGLIAFHPSMTRLGTPSENEGHIFTTLGCFFSMTLVLWGRHHYFIILQNLSIIKDTHNIYIFDIEWKWPIWDWICDVLSRDTFIGWWCTNLTSPSHNPCIVSAIHIHDPTSDTNTPGLSRERGVC
jgi:hypothetical protein